MVFRHGGNHREAGGGAPRPAESAEHGFRHSGTDDGENRGNVRKFTAGYSASGFIYAGDERAGLLKRN